MTIGYSEFINQLEQAGYNTTNINSARGEADFSDYGNALSDELQSMITDSFDCEQDYALQEQIAALYGNRSNLHRSDFIAACKAAGLEISVSYIKTSHISDNKFDGRYDTDISNANIGVYTISDGKGGEITIADANGNGALEIEELFMNQILQGVSVDVEKLAASKANGTAWTGSAQGATAAESVKEAEAESKVEEVSQSEFNSMVEEYLAQGYGETLAENLANSNIDGTERFNYTGLFEAETESENEDVTQMSFNKTVNRYISNGKTIEEATALANANLGVDMEYTGSEKDKIEEDEKKAA